ncbi:MATE family efflux transporter [Gottfriedia luciferensis]|uniref:MATE family efflux transporter n=1 Tax=Gottfriedia luciferensis TaxID=178774 RepID=UPI000B43AEA8|nr:MATE family efflux transporter [Gottfriedia luciferensis]
MNLGNCFSIASIILIGQAIGEKNKSDIKEYRKWSYFQSAVSMTFVTGTLAVASPLIGKLFTHNQTVLHLLVITLLIDTVS